MNFHPLVGHIVFPEQPGYGRISIDFRDYSEILQAGWRFFLFPHGNSCHVIHVMSFMSCLPCHVMSFMSCHVTYSAVPLLVCGHAPSIIARKASFAIQKAISTSQNVSVPNFTIWMPNMGISLKRLFHKVKIWFYWYLTVKETIVYYIKIYWSDRCRNPLLPICQDY